MISEDEPLFVTGELWSSPARNDQIFINFQAFFELVKVVLSYLFVPYRRTSLDSVRRLGTSEVVSRAKLKSVRVMGVLVSGFIVCWTPYYVMSLWWWIDQADISSLTALQRSNIHRVATPALLCHKEPAQGTQSPILEDFAWESWRSNMMNQPMQWEQSLDISLTRSLPRSSTTKCRNCSGPSPVPTTASTLCSIRWWGRNQSELQSFHTEKKLKFHIFLRTPRSSTILARAGVRPSITSFSQSRLEKVSFI